MRQPQPELRNVLFVCIGNICRSPMAAALANKYGSDVLRASSAGLSPGVVSSPHTRKVLAEKNVDLGDHMPRSLEEVDLRGTDVIVNISGYSMPELPKHLPAITVLNWTVPDPYGGSLQAYRAARDQLEMLVMQLILKMRMGKI